MTYEFKTQRRVEFAETDMAGILHFSNYFRYMEETEHAFFRSMGFRVHTASESGAWGWVRSKAACDFREPLRYEELVELHLLVREKRSKSIEYLFRFRKLEPSKVEVARGTMVVVCVSKFPDEGRFESMNIPPELDARIEAAPPDLLT
ncbi:MAG: acyl-CoA thioesterase [Myxococcota bacterium]